MFVWRTRGTFRCASDPADPFEDAAPTSGVCTHEVRQPRHHRGQPRPNIDQSHRIRLPRPQPPVVVVRQEFGLICWPYRRSTGQSPLHPLQDRHRSSDSRTGSLRQPSVSGLPCSISQKQAGAAARRVYLFHRHAVARAHRAARCAAGNRRCRRIADSSAPRRIVILAANWKCVSDFRRVVVGPEPQILVDAVGTHDLAGIHFPIRDPRST